MCKRPMHLQLKWAILLWRHTWRKNWVNCAVLIGNSAGLRTVLSVVFHTVKCAVHSGNPTVSPIYRPTPTMASSRGNQLQHPFLAIHSADQHLMIYSFSNTTSYSTFYALFSSFRITLWPMWIANNKRPPCFNPPKSHAQEDTQNWQKKLKILMGNLCCAREHSVQFFVQFFTQLNCTV